MGLKEVVGGDANMYFDALQGTTQDLGQALLESQSNIDTVVKELCLTN